MSYHDDMEKKLKLPFQLTVLGKKLFYVLSVNKSNGYRIYVNILTGVNLSSIYLAIISFNGQFVLSRWRLRVVIKGGGWG